MSDAFRQKLVRGLQDKRSDIEKDLMAARAELAKAVSDRDYWRDMARKANPGQRSETSEEHKLGLEKVMRLEGECADMERQIRDLTDDILEAARGS